MTLENQNGLGKRKMDQEHKNVKVENLYGWRNMLKINEIKSFYTFIFFVVFGLSDRLYQMSVQLYICILSICQYMNWSYWSWSSPTHWPECSGCFGFCQPEQLFSSLPRTFKEPHCSPSAYQPNKQQTVMLFPPHCSLGHKMLHQ